MRAAVLAVAVLWVASGCGPDAEAWLGAEGEEDFFELEAQELRADLMLPFLNGPDATVEVLRDEIGLNLRTTNSILGHVWGPDGVRGTADDDPIDSLKELDAIAWVGPETLANIDRYVTARGGAAGTPVVVEGVSFSGAEAALAVAVCNDARVEQVGFTAAQRNALVAARPHGALASVAATSGIGSAALTKLRTFVAGQAPVPAPQPGGCSEVAGSRDGVAFTAAEACLAVEFLNKARFSEMGRLPKNSLDFVYAGGPSRPHGPAGRSVWARLNEFTDAAGVGKTTVAGLKASLPGWAPNGVSWDTVASAWADRAALVDRPVRFDKVYVSRVLPLSIDPDRPWTGYQCVELRDRPGATNWMMACYLRVSADSAGGCAAEDCTANTLGTWVSARGELNRTSMSGAGGYRVNLSASARLGAPNPAVP